MALEIETSEFCENSEVYWRDEPLRVMGMQFSKGDFSKLDTFYMGDRGLQENREHQRSRTTFAVK